MKKLNTILIAAGATAIATITAIIAEKAIKKSKKSEKATEEATVNEKATASTNNRYTRHQWQTAIKNATLTISYAISLEKQRLERAKLDDEDSEEKRCSKCIDILEKALDDAKKSHDDYERILEIYMKAMEQYSSIRFPEYE